MCSLGFAVCLPVSVVQLDAWRRLYHAGTRAIHRRWAHARAQLWWYMTVAHNQRAHTTHTHPSQAHRQTPGSDRAVTLSAHAESSSPHLTPPSHLRRETVCDGCLFSPVVGRNGTQQRCWWSCICIAPRGFHPQHGHRPGHQQCAPAGTGPVQHSAAAATAARRRTGCHVPTTAAGGGGGDGRRRAAAPAAAARAAAGASAPRGGGQHAAAAADGGRLLGELRFRGNRVGRRTGPSLQTRAHSIELPAGGSWCCWPQRVCTPGATSAPASVSGACCCRSTRTHPHTHIHTHAHSLSLAHSHPPRCQTRPRAPRGCPAT